MLLDDDVLRFGMALLGIYELKILHFVPPQEQTGLAKGRFSVEQHELARIRIDIDSLS